MPIQPPKIPKKFQPRGFEIIHEDRDLLVGIKAAGLLTVAAKWERDHTVHGLLNLYIRKGNTRSTKEVFVVHRLDQATTGLLVFAKSEEIQQRLKNNWKDNRKIYFAIVHGQPKKKTGRISSFLAEDEDYTVRETRDEKVGKLAETDYEVLTMTDRYSLLRVTLLTGRKNQIRVHMAGLGHPLVGDDKYGPAAKGKPQPLALHAAELEFTHPFHGRERLRFTAAVPAHFPKLVPYDYPARTAAALPVVSERS